MFAPEHTLYSIQRTYKASPKDPANYKSAAHEVLDTLVKADGRIEVKLNTKAAKLVANDKGQVLTVVTEDGASYTAKKAVIMATGGYSANGKLMAQLCPTAALSAGGAAAADGNGPAPNAGGGRGPDRHGRHPTFPMGLVSRDNPKTGSIASPTPGRPAACRNRMAAASARDESNPSIPRWRSRSSRMPSV